MPQTWLSDRIPQTSIVVYLWFFSKRKGATMLLKVHCKQRSMIIWYYIWSKQGKWYVKRGKNKDKPTQGSLTFYKYKCRQN